MEGWENKIDWARRRYALPVYRAKRGKRAGSNLHEGCVAHQEESRNIVVLERL